MGKEDEMISSNEPVVQWETITPEQAAALLATSPGNRSLRQHRVKRWAEDMAAGRFQMNGETIKINQNGQLRDGHHRLNAVVLAGVPVRMLVVRGVLDEAIKTVDGGAARTPGDRLMMEGERNVNALAAALVWQARYERRAATLPGRSAVAFQGEDVFVALAAHPGMRDAVSRATGFRFLRKALSPSLLAFCLYSTPESSGFWGAVESGAQLPPGSPALLLRDRLGDNRVSKARLHDDELLALIIKAHNAWLAGRLLHTLRWRTGGDKPEAFPSWAPADA